MTLQAKSCTETASLLMHGLPGVGEHASHHAQCHTALVIMHIAMLRGKQQAC